MRFPPICFFLSAAAVALMVSCRSEVPEAISEVYHQLPDSVDFNFHVRPILSDRCYACHGPDEGARKAELRLDLEANAFAALEDSASYAFVPGQPGESVAIARILHHDPDYLMPPPDSEMSLSPREKALIFKWVEQGAKWKKHWAFIPPSRRDWPKGVPDDWAVNEIDHFTWRKMKDHGLSPAAPAPKEQWLRRVNFDLNGLPPTPEAIADFLADTSPGAYEKVVDRLLADPAYGERMASVWMDVSRYADSHGYQDDRPRTMWPWRDWVIQAFNDNMPYDEFVTQQLAGDLLPEASYHSKLATGFNRNHAITQEGGVVQEEYLTEYAADRTQTFSTAFLGLTMQCARCHSHKYDPITQKEYYSLFSFFNNIPERGQISYFDLSPAPSMEMMDPLFDEEAQKIKAWIGEKEKELALLQKQPVGDFITRLDQAFPLSPPDSTLPSGLLAHFRLNEPPNRVFNSQVSGQPQGFTNINLPPSIPAPEQVPGQTGKALRFDGANFLSLGEIGDFEWYDDFSMGAWIQHSGQHQKNAGMLARRVGEQKRQGYELVLTPGNRLAARLIHHYQPGRLHYAIEVQSRTTIPAQQWHHVAMTYDGSGKATGLRLYINGQNQPLRIVMDSLREKTILNGNDFLVGNWNHRARELDDLYGFKGGTVDEVVLYDRELSALEIQGLTGLPHRATPAQRYAHYLRHENTEYRSLKAQLDSLRRIDLQKPRVMIMEEVDTIKTTFVLERGAYDAPRDTVQRVTPKSVLAFTDEYPANRLGLAQWLFDDNHPLTSRVIVNRFWQLFFGRGIVATPEDFGNQGALPTHPQLLDWLAVSFRENDWNMKDLARQIVLSATYRQDARPTVAKLKKDKANHWLARGPSRRLTAEMLRDQALAASGLYYEKVGGKWVKPYQPPGIWKELANQIGENKYRPSQGRNLYRRSLYNYWKRTIPPPTLLVFDAAERAECTVRRHQTSTPLQSLVMLNDPTYVEAARVLAEKLWMTTSSETDIIAGAFVHLLSRSIREEESSSLMALLKKEKARLAAHPDQALHLLSIGASAYHRQLDPVRLAALTVVINTIMNLDEAKFK